MVCHRNQLPFHSSDFLIALLISASLGLFSLTCKGALAGCMSGISLGGSLLSSSLKCSSHLYRYSSWPMSKSPLLSLTGLSGIFLSPSSFLVMEYSSFASPLPDASSECLARSSRKFLRSFLMRFSVFFIFFLASIFFRVSRLKKVLCCLRSLPSVSSHVSFYAVFMPCHILLIVVWFSPSSRCCSFS